MTLAIKYWLQITWQRQQLLRSAQAITQIRLGHQLILMLLYVVLVLNLAIRQLRIASNSGSIQFLSRITGSPTQIDFVNFVSMNSPTQIWYLEARYIAYDGGFNMFDNEFAMAFQQFSSLTQINSSPGSTRS